MIKEEAMLKKRLMDLSSRAFQRNIVTFSDFLNLNEQHILHTIPKHELSAGYETFGGYGFAERKMAAFVPEDFKSLKGSVSFDEGEERLFCYPFSAVAIRPLHAKFAEDLSHRDYLGSIMNLGIERSKFGDIVMEEDAVIAFVCNEVADYVAENLTRIRHTSVMCEKWESVDVSLCPSFTEIKGTVPSVRLDAVLSVAFPMSRSKLCDCIEAGKVFVGGKLVTSNGYRLAEGDLITVRGMGRIAYDGVLSETKKGRLFVSVRKYS